MISFTFILVNSSILSEPQVFQLGKWLKDEGMFGSYTQCYNAARDGWHILKFHSLCDGKPNTVSIFNDGFAIFGGYTDVPWKSKKH